MLHRSKVILSLGEKNADGDNNKEEGGEQQEKTERLAACLQPPSPTFPSFQQAAPEAAVK